MPRIIFSAIIAIFLTTPLLFSADWPVFHGPKGDNVSPDTGLLKSWPEGGPKLLWTADFLGFGYSGVSISGDRIYTSGNVEKDGKPLSMVFCLDNNGKLIWENDNGPAHVDKRRFDGTRGTPTIDGEFVYDESALGEVACFDAKSGTKIWHRNILKDYGAEMPRWFLGESVVIDGDNLICTVGGPKACALALDKRTGKTVWESAPTVDPPGAMVGYATPYFFEHDGIRIVAVMSNETVEGLDPKTGKTLFSIPWKNFRTTNVTQPIYRDGCLFLTSGYDFGAKLYKLSKNTDGTITPTEIRYEKKFDNHHHAVVMVGDYVYGTTHKGSWGSIHFKTGELGYLVRIAGCASVHLADGLIYALTEDEKTVILYKPEPKEFVELSRFELPHDAEKKSWAHPVVCNGKLYLRHAQYLYCYDVKEK